MNQNLSNEDELQKAIDDITNNAVNETTEAPSEPEAAPEIKNNEPQPMMGAVSMPNEMTMPDPINEPLNQPVAQSEPETSAVSEAPENSENFTVPDLNIPEPMPVQEDSKSEELPTAAEPEITIPEPTTSEEPIIQTSGPVIEKTDDKNSEPKSADINEVKKKALRDLLPLINKMQKINPEQRFDVIYEGMESLEDESFANEAYEAALQISDESARAEALLKLVEKL